MTASATTPQRSTDIRIGIDLGGTKIETILLAGRGDIIARQRIATPQGDYEATLQAIKKTIDLMTRQHNISARLPIGLGAPGTLSRRSGLMKNCNSTCLNGQALPEDLSRLIGRQVRIANDADCFALSEASDGAAAGANNVFAAILGTGVGGGIVINQSLVRGINGITGEWGHNRLNLTATKHKNRVCYCGRTDCVETWLSGPALAKDFLEITGQKLTAAQISALAVTDQEMPNKQQKLAQGLITAYIKRLALALAQVINLLDPDVIVLGGGLSNIDSLYRMLPEALAEHVFSDQLETKIIKAKHGDSSGVRGAAWLWPLGE